MLVPGGPRCSRPCAEEDATGFRVRGCGEEQASSFQGTHRGCLVVGILTTSYPPTTKNVMQLYIIAETLAQLEPPRVCKVAHVVAREKEVGVGSGQGALYQAIHFAQRELTNMDSCRVMSFRAFSGDCVSCDPPSTHRPPHKALPRPSSASHSPSAVSSNRRLMDRHTLLQQLVIVGLLFGRRSLRKVGPMLISTYESSANEISAVGS
ncbi:hypothetical protein BHE74_00006522 [Ensete ventricosum]|nr:hypothetical protein GW17_00023732 [Ensete ventricosum]RWW84852.1 hypothetical protein BHE74_00006522 [Ensete ventricosum]RZR86260.1 hypothetical protein BHM03_00013429 [Ensete ventricosum]